MNQLMNYFQQTGLGDNISILAFVLITFSSILSSLLVAYFYSIAMSQRLFRENGIQKTFPILGLALTTIFAVLQFSIPLSLGLLGSLSIVRFRNPIKNPMDIGFLLIIIACSLLSSVGNFKFLIILLFFIYLLIVLINKKNWSASFLNLNERYVISIRVNKEANFQGTETVLSNFKRIMPNEFLMKSITDDGNFLYISIIVSLPEKFDFSSIHSSLPKGSVVNMFHE